MELQQGIDDTGKRKSFHPRSASVIMTFNKKHRTYLHNNFLFSVLLSENNRAELYQKANNAKRGCDMHQR